MTSQRSSCQPDLRVVVTGRGVISPIGSTTSDFWTALLAGRSGVGPITAFDASELPTRIAGEVDDFDPGAYMPRRVSRRIDRYAQFAVAVALQAMEEAKLTIELDSELAGRCGIVLGSGYGPSSLLQQSALQLRDSGYRALGPFVSAASAIDSAPGEIALRLGIQGPSGALSTACASGTSAIGEAARAIRHGYADVMLAGGSDDAVCPVDIGSASMSRALSRRNDEPERASRPFDRDRDGFVMAAGAGVVVLEDAEHAMRRGAQILAEIVGYGASSDAYHPTAPHPEGAGARTAMRLALQDAGVEPSAIDHINAHGTSTTLNDRTESEAIRAVFGDYAPNIPISSVKSMTGHMIGAAGAVELIATIEAIRTGQVPPTINCDNPEDTELNYVPHRPQAHQTTLAMSNSFGFAGHNAVLVVRSWNH
jgi:3-oxoacyl-[acyl-carrier-protein] synthase II